jgi:shikimate kinase
VIGVFLAGEGATELGGWAAERPYRTTSPNPGVLQVLLEKVASDGWEIRDAAVWKSIRKFRVRTERRDAEVQNVLGVALEASERGLQALVFSRDRDRDVEREKRIEDGILAAQRQFPSLKIVGGVAIEEIEAWTLAAHGLKKAYELRHPKESFSKRNLELDFQSQVELIREADLFLTQDDSPSLRTWLDRARAVLAPEEPQGAPIFLIGFMATGKTTVGGLLAKKLGWSHVDLDHEISRLAGKAVSEIFASEGEAGFRRREYEALRAVGNIRKTVISTGGGAGAREDNLTWMLRSGHVVTLSITAEEAVKRAHGGKGRPLLEGQADPVAVADELLRTRAPFYARAHFTVQTVGRRPHEVTKDILDWISVWSPGKVDS